MNYENLTVKKPWGHEYVIYQNSDVGVWYLNIKKGEKTSFHAHPNKKTGLIIMSGSAKVSFMNGSHLFKSSDKIMIRNGVFHSTEAVDGDVQMLEIETPNDKEDIIRLEDYYGRAGEPYENEDHYCSDLKRLSLDDKIGDCTLSKIQINSREELFDREPSKIMILGGKIFFKEFCVCGPGDIVDNVTLNRLARKFDITPMSVLEIKLVTNGCL